MNDYLEKKLKILIIGGGPAGASCGIELAKAGYNVTIIDKAKFPRKKLCAGIISEKTTSLIKRINPSVFNSLANNNLQINEMAFLKIYSGTQILDRFKIVNKTYVVEREIFDNLLIKEFKKYGGILIEECKVVDILIGKKEIKLYDGSTVKYDLLVGADGAFSVVRDKLKFNKKPKALCLQTTLKKHNRGENCIGFVFNKIKKGYAWKITCRDTEITGYGCIAKKPFDYKLKMNEVLETFDTKSGSSFCGAYVPMKGYIRRKIGKDSIYLIGDAAGFVDSATGEGIYFAMLSGHLIGRMITSNSDEYYDEYKRMVKQVRNPYYIYYLFYNRYIHTIAMWIFKNDKSFFKYIYSNLISSYNCSLTKLLYISILSIVKILFSKIFVNRV